MPFKSTNYIIHVRVQATNDYIHNACLLLYMTFYGEKNLSRLRKWNLRYRIFPKSIRSKVSRHYAHFIIVHVSGKTCLFISYNIFLGKSEGYI